MTWRRRLSSIGYLLAASFTSVSCADGGAHEPDVGDTSNGNGAATALGQESSAEKWALLVGINEYESTSISTLRGCVNDVERMKAILISKFEFPEENVMVLTNEEATHQGIVVGIQGHLIGNAREGDIVVFHYSGHGSQMKDGDDDDGETDGMDETIVPHDSRVGAVFDITDDEINGLLALLEEKTENITFILDSCHSGTGTRAAELVRAAPPDNRDPPPEPSYARAARGSDPASLRQESANFVLLAAADSRQLAYEYTWEGKQYGAFTFYLSSALSEEGAGATYAAVMEKVKINVKSKYNSQTPQLEGTGEGTYVFSDSTSIADPYFLASPKASGGVTFAAGDVHGLTVGSVFEVFPPGTKKFDPLAKPTARVRLTTVSAFEATGEVLDNGSVAPASRAVEREHVYPDQTLVVHYAGRMSPTLLAVRARLENLNYIEEQPDPLGYDILLAETDGKIVLEGADTTMLSPPVPVDRANADSVVADLVESWARWFNLLAMSNPASKIEIDVTLSPNRDLLHGEPLDCTVTNTSTTDLFITILDVSGDGSVTQIFPNPRDSGAKLLTAGRSETISFPSVFVPAGRESVKDILKVFATTTEIDMRPLTQPPITARAPTRGASSDPLARLLEQASSGASRGATAAVSTGGWVVEQKSFVVRRQ